MLGLLIIIFHLLVMEKNKMITFKEVDKDFLELYDKVTINVDVYSEYKVNRINNGLGGFILEEIKVEPYIKDLSIYERATEYENEFDITNWRFYMAFNDDIPVGAMTIVGKKDGYQQMIIECQNNNVQACKFYQKQGAVLSKIDMYAYYLEPEIRNEIQFVWYLDI